MAGYTKLFGSIIFSTIWKSTKDAKILWITMMAMADRDGLVESSVPGLAGAAELTMDETVAALAILMSPDRFSKNPANEGRRIEKVDDGWLLLNYSIYRDKLTAEHRREKGAERVRKHRERKTKDASPTPTTPEPTNAFDGSPNETTCPPLLEDFERLVAPEMVKKLQGVTLEQLTESANRFVGYYTIGKGMGQKRRFWMRELRNWVVKDHGAGKLAGPKPRAPRNAADALYARAQATLAQERKAAAE